ncbi:hypothetical protein [Dyadobacter diqingensis]|uniref:hypothetical protein n=1 Tax=Dyadobacter diqingensis TaxID=2938121 RepID=UPI0020C3C8A8|nr:hypothetical protein [Dyadobacter diqingensis]
MKFLKAFIYVFLTVLLAEATTDYVWEHRSFFATALLIVIAGLVIFSVAKSNRKARR